MAQCPTAPSGPCGTGDINQDGVVDCDDEALFTCYIKTGCSCWPPQADMNCDGSLNLQDTILFRQIMDACSSCAQTVEISCGATGSLVATPSNITANPGDWVRFTINTDCDDFCSSSRQIAIDAPDLLLTYTGRGDAHCSVKIPSNAAAGQYKYSVTLYTSGTNLCTAVTSNPLDPYITVASVSGVGDPEKPDHNPLSLRNTPNPFTPATSIHYLLSEESTVTVVVYDLHGARVKSLLANARQGAGEHLLHWDGKNDSGQDLPSGVYIYNVAANQHFVSGRMVLAR
jgi:FlgD Ig-like domain